MRAFHRDHRLTAASSPDFGQFAFEYPAVWLMHKVPLRWFVGVSIIIWSIVVGCQAAANSFGQMAAIRFILGMSEGAVRCVIADEPARLVSDWPR